MEFTPEDKTGPVVVNVFPENDKNVFQIIPPELSALTGSEPVPVYEPFNITFTDEAHVTSLTLKTNASAVDVTINGITQTVSTIVLIKYIFVSSVI